MTIIPLNKILLNISSRTNLAVILVGIFLFAFKFPFRSRLLSWWDSAQFGLGLEHFSVAEHRPHPPGYPLYVLLGKLLELVFHEPTICFVLIGLVSSIIATILIFHLARDMTGRVSVGLIAAALYGFAPLTFYHELKALTYVMSAFFSILVAWEANRIIKGVEVNPWRISLALGFMGMVRPYESILLLPFAIWTVSRLGFRKFIYASLTYIILQIAWIIPTAMLSGGFDKYIFEVFAESGKHQRNIDALADKPTRNLIQNLEAFYYYMRQSFPFWGFFIIISAFRSIFKLKTKSQLIFFFLLWFVPALLLYSINNVNYAAIPLFISPPLAILIAFALDYLAGLIEKIRFKFAHFQIRRTSLNILFALIIAVHMLTLFFSVDVRLFGENHRKYDPLGFNYYKLLAGDGYIYMLVDGVKDISVKFSGTDSVIVLSDLNYRVLMYYLPDYEIIWTRYLSQKRAGADGKTKIALNREDSTIQLPEFVHNHKKYWYYRINEKQKLAVFTDEMIGNLDEKSRFFSLPGVEASKAYVLDLNEMWGIFFTYEKFGVISRETAQSLGLDE